MTANQLRYAELLESRRHNKTTESQGWSGLRETSRHNVATEGIQSAQVAEMRRHNVETEGINWYSAEALANLQTAQEAKVTSEVGVQRDTLDETIAQNDASNALRRGEINVERGKLKELISNNDDINALRQAEIDVRQAGLDETIRHNKRQEAIDIFNAGTRAMRSGVQNINDSIRTVLDVGDTIAGIRAGGAS